MKRFVIFLCLIFSLTGCSTNLVVQAPTNISYVYDDLIWDEVIDATKYEVQIGENTYMSDTNVFSMSEFDEGDYQIVVTAITAKEKRVSSEIAYISINKTPKIISNYQIDYVRNQNIIVEFSLVYATFGGLSGNGIATSDYSFDGRYLTINYSFFESILATNPVREMVILSYSYSSAENVTVGYLFIKTN